MLKILFLKDTKVVFLNSKTGKREWYGSDYWSGTSMEVADILSGNPVTIHAKCLDGEIAVLETEAVQIERQQNVQNKRTGDVVDPEGLGENLRKPSKSSLLLSKSPPVTPGDAPVAVVQKKRQRQTPGAPGRDNRVQVYRADK